MSTEPVIDQAPSEHDHLTWFDERYNEAPRQIIDFFAGDGLDMSGATVADIGSGDGIMDLGVSHHAKPAKLVGYDIRPTDVAGLQRMAEAYGVSEPYPNAEQLAFEQSGPVSLPAPNDTFDYAYSWSVFEHVSKPTEMFKEIQRVLKPDGKLFLQIWPLYYSEHGGHLWMTYRDKAFPHLTSPDEEILERTQFEPGTDPTRSGEDEYRSLNRLTIDDLQRAMLAGGLLITKLELLTEAVHLPPEAALRPLSGLGISGVKLLATPRFK